MIPKPKVDYRLQNFLNHAAFRPDPFDAFRKNDGINEHHAVKSDNLKMDRCQLSRNHPDMTPFLMSHNPSVTLRHTAGPTRLRTRGLILALGRLPCVMIMVMLGACVTAGDEPSETVGDELQSDVTADKLTAAAERSISLLETASAGSAERRTCFTCHSQAHPVLVIVEAKRRGLRIDEANLANQLRHTAEHLDRGRDDYLEGRGQGGKSDTAGYALWALSAGEVDAPETTAPVVDWLLSQQLKAGNWKRSSDRPPSEASHFATTYVALKGIVDHDQGDQKDGITDKLVDRTADPINRARAWLIDTAAEDTEDRVFRLLSLRLVAASDPIIIAAAQELLDSQREDGGWSQTETMKSDAYATGTAMFALQQTEQLAANAPAYLKGLNYLLKSQHADGSWHVTSRSRPFQAYYETGFPHGKDQFISTSATAWATLAILLSQDPVQNESVTPKSYDSDLNN